jgi:hypothetical protein
MLWHVIFMDLYIPTELLTVQDLQDGLEKFGSEAPCKSLIHVLLNFYHIFKASACCEFFKDNSTLVFFLFGLPYQQTHPMSSLFDTFLTVP